MKKINLLLGMFLAFSTLFCLVADDTEELEEYKKLLKESDIPPTEEGIIQHIVDISLADEDLNNIDKLIQQLASNSFIERNSAQKKLESMGAEVERKVKVASNSRDPEIRMRARKILQNLHNNDTIQDLINCYETLKLLKSEKAVSAILQSATLCSDQYLLNIAEETLGTLVKMKDMETIEKALKNRNLSVRMLALSGYGKLSGLENSSKLYPFLKSEDSEMRLAAAKAMANLGDRNAIPAFINLMNDKSVAIRSSSASFLRQFTNKHFDYSAYDDKSERIEVLTAWTKWLAEKGKTAEVHFPLESFASGSYLNGHTLIALGNGNGGVVELDHNNKEVWRYEFNDCWSAEKLANGNYLIGSHSGSKLVEVTPKKKIVWEFNTPAMRAVQLPNGNILAATHNNNSVIEIRKKDKKIVWKYETNANCFSAFRLPNGNTLISGYQFIREVTPKKEVVWDYKHGSYFYCIQPLPNGNIMVSDNTKSVFELNRKKKRVWQYDDSNTTGVYKLSNGHILIATSSEIIELDKKSKVIWRYQGNNYGFAKR